MSVCGQEGFVMVKSRYPTPVGPFILSSGPRNFRSGLKIALSHHDVQKGHGFCRFPAKSVTIIHIVYHTKSLDNHLIQAFAPTVKSLVSKFYVTTNSILFLVI